MDPIIIIGSGMAAYTLAKEFRKLDKATPLTLISAADGRSYPKPMLSNALAKGKTAEQIAGFDARAMMQILAAQIVVNTTVQAVDRRAHTLKTTNGSSYRYKKLILAVGASPVAIAIKGDAASEILSINSLQDYAIFRQHLLNAKHIALVGAGLIGCELANDLISMGRVRVSVIGTSAMPMATALPKQVAAELKQCLANAGVEWHLETAAKALDYSGDGFALSLTNNTIINPCLVVAAVGLRANIKLASQAGLAVNRGVITDRFLQTTDGDIYALGDCAEVNGHNLLFVAPLLAAAKALAKTLAGEPTPVKYPAMPIVVKTPLYPLVIAPPARGAQGRWVFEKAESGFGLQGLFIDDESLLGFVLSGDCAKNKPPLTKQLPAILP